MAGGARQLSQHVQPASGCGRGRCGDAGLPDLAGAPNGRSPLLFRVHPTELSPPPGRAQHPLEAPPAA